MTVIYGKFNNSDKSVSIMQTNGKQTVVVNKPLREIRPVSNEVYDYASDEIGSFFMSACQRRK